MTKKNTKRPKNPYTATEQDFLNFCQWLLVSAFSALMVTAIVMADAKYARLAIVIGIVLAYAIHKDWFKINSGQ